MTFGGKRKGKVAKEITDKSFCSTKNLWYYDVKLHSLNHYNKGTLPYPESIVISKASENDLNVFRENWPEIQGRTFFCDKIYHNHDFFDNLFTKNQITM
jgi:hypothetical protein